MFYYVKNIWIQLEFNLTLAENKEIKLCVKMDITEDEETAKLLDVKDIEIIESLDVDENNENDRNVENTSLLDEKQPNGFCASEAANQQENGIIEPSTERRSDEPTELSFEKGDEKNPCYLIIQEKNAWLFCLYFVVVVVVVVPIVAYVSHSFFFIPVYSSEIQHLLIVSFNAIRFIVN